MPNNAAFDFFKKRILLLSDAAWGGNTLWTDVENWLKNFKGETGNTIEIEQIHALFILSQFLFFGGRQIRELLHALYRDNFYIPLVQKIRKDNNNTRDLNEIKSILQREIGLTRFLGIGNPSESGAHLLYYFRQENNLPSSLFLDISHLIKIEKDKYGNDITNLLDTNIKRYIFIDDICGTGYNAITCSNNLLSNINNNVEFCYLTLFATTSGLSEVNRNTVFKGNCKTIFELDNTYKILADDSRYILNCPDHINQEIISKIVKHYGMTLWEEHPCGYGDNQLVLGMYHNIPNNTIPIVWYGDGAWVPIFKRYVKVKGIEI